MSSSSSSSRLKRRAENEPELLSKTNLNESFVTVGTALPSLASTRKDQGEYVPIWKQEVRDEKGRRRLHGAFTGGFSAGYFNTVGSKEGWAPSTFVSSRNAGRDGGPAAGTAGARPEDFMDEEDLAELKASKGFKTSDKYGDSTGSGAFAGEGRPRTGLAADPSYSSAVENSLNDLVKPGTNRIGEKIMMKMGWRPGQGVGPRLSHARRKEVLKDLGIARASPADDEEEVDDSEEAKKHMYAPVDRPLVTFDGKENQMGLGYHPGRTLDQSLSAGAGPSHASTSRAGFEAYETFADSRTASLPRGGAFGISALEDADDDDEDIYSTGPGGRLSGSRGGLTLHDEEDDEEQAFGARRRPELLQYQDRSKLRAMQSTARNRPAVAKADLQKFSDGTPVVPGFVLADKVQPPDKWFPAPSIPKGWQPNPKAVIERDRIKAASGPDGTAPNAGDTPVAGQKGRMNMLTADDRAKMLGEPVAPKSVFDYLSSKNKERLAHLPPPDSKASIRGAARSIAGKVGSSAPLPQPEVETTVKIPSIETRIAQGALKGFMPYGDDLARQARYRSYLTHAAAPYDSQYAPRPMPGSTIADLNRELADFASAAMIFKPMTGLMANRFTSGTTASVLQAPTPGLSVPVPKAAATPETDLASEGAEAARKQREQDEKDKQDPRRAAARAGEFGPLTRTVTPFYPARLLCKRFNVPDPHPDGPANGSTAHDATDSAAAPQQSGAAASDVLDQGVMDQILRDRTAGSTTREASAPTIPGDAAAATDAPQKEVAMPTLETVGLGEDESQGRDTLTYKKPPMDIFKAIFADSDDDDSDEDEEPNATAGGAPSKMSDAQLATSAPSAASVKAALLPPEVFTPVPMTVDSIASFKPTFVSKSDRSTTEKQESGKDKKGKKKAKKSSAVVSFEMDDGEGAEHSFSTPKEAKSRKRKGEKKERKVKKEKSGDGQREVQAEAEEDEWVEKETPAAAAVSSSAHGATNGHSAQRGQRVRASELF